MPKPRGRRRGFLPSRFKPITSGQPGEQPIAKPSARRARETNVRPQPPERTARPPLTVHLAAPRGFCAGVDRAIQIVELASAKFGAPVYVRHEIVHNRFVVERLKAKGAVFVEELDEIPETDPP